VSHQHVQLFSGHANHVRCLAVWDTQTVVSGSDDMTIKVWSICNAQLSHDFVAHKSGCSISDTT
jgi:WD40 repeat protein